jgi:hypothetical protein
VYVHLTAVEWPNDGATYKARKGAYIAVDIIAKNRRAELVPE